MSMMGDGKWKEGRIGGVSLCYVDPGRTELGWVIEHHAAVGIRASLAVRQTEVIAAHLQTVAERNWDLAVRSGADNELLREALERIDSRPTRGLLIEPGQTPDSADWLYRITEGPGAISPETRLSPENLLGATAANGAVEPLIAAMDEVLTTELWRIWLIDNTSLHALGQTGHAALLRFLGDHHDRIWCAPVRDILGWHRERTT